MQPTRPPSSDSAKRSMSAYENSISAPPKAYAPDPLPAISNHYDAATMLLHWTVALLVLLVALSSFFIGDAGTDAATRMFRTFHYVAGTLVFVLVLAWFAWRATQEELTDIPNIGTIERRIVASMNGAIKIFLILIPLTGIIYSFAMGQHIDIGFTTFEFDLSLSGQNTARLGLTHNVLGKALLGLALLHSLYGLYHHFMLRDRLLSRMLPWH